MGFRVMGSGLEGKGKEGRKEGRKERGTQHAKSTLHGSICAFKFD